MKTHISLGTNDLNASVAFYRALLDSKPAKQYDDYALFLTDNPDLELSLTIAPNVTAPSDTHYGIAVDSPNLVKEAIDRLRDAGLPVDVGVAETCCFAEQDKVWATDPDGRRWETYYVIAETENRQSENMTCCEESAREAVSCCSA